MKNIGNTANSIISDETYNTCFNNEKLCFGLPDGCVQDKTCEILGLSFPNSSNVAFELLAPIESSRQYYIAYSLSKISVNMRCKRIYGTRNLISNSFCSHQSLWAEVLCSAI